jgi:hypothetical protein
MAASGKAARNPARKTAAREPWKRLKVDSWKSFQDEIEEFLDGGWLFRGVTSVRHDLIPSIGRARPEFSYSPEVERGLFEQFQREALPLLAARPQNPWEWLALAQHFGIPTRLLDWSETPYVSLFFAVWGNDEDDAGLYIVKRPEHVPALHCDPFDVREVSFFYPGYVTARLVSQRGLFTVHPDPTQVYTTPDMLQIVIDRHSKADFRRKLDTAGIHHAAIYADLDGLSRRLLAVRGYRAMREGQASPPAADPTDVVPEEERSAKVNPLDPQKGQWGRRDRRNGWRLAAKVTTISPDWYAIELRVEPDPPGSKSPSGQVTFHLHDTFREPVKSVKMRSGRATLSVSAYGAFTVGAVVEADGTPLELDLAELPSAPERFRKQ